MPLVRSAQSIALALCGAGVALHLYTVVFKAEGGADTFGFLLGLLAWSCTPYAIAAMLARGRRAVWALGSAAACLAADGFMHYAVFVAPRGSTAALGLLFMPMWNLLAVGPSGALLAGLLHRWLGRRPGAAD